MKDADVGSGVKENDEKLKKTKCIIAVTAFGSQNGIGKQNSD